MINYMTNNILLLSSLLLSNVNGDLLGNDQVIIGVADTAELNVPYEAGVLGLPASDPLGIGYIGIRNGEDFRPGEYDAGSLASTEPGCKCEGWGVSVNESYSCYADGNQSPRTVNMNFISWTSTSTSNGISIVEHSSGIFRVTHDFHTLGSDNHLIEVTVRIENLGNGDLNNVKYVRAMDWDITPTHFSEYVTIKGTAVDKLFRSHDDGFATPDPLQAFSTNPINPGTLDVDFEDSGPNDHGAYFAFNFGTLPAKQAMKFDIYYGVAPTELEALQVINESNIEVYSLGQSSSTNGHILGTPATFIFGFSNVNESVICSYVPNTKVVMVIDNACRSLYKDECNSRSSFLYDLVDTIHDGENVDMSVISYKSDADVKLTFKNSDKSRSLNKVQNSIGCNRSGALGLKDAVETALEQLEDEGYDAAIIVLVSYCQQTIGDVCDLASEINANGIRVVSLTDVDGDADYSCLINDDDDLQLSVDFSNPDTTVFSQTRDIVQGCKQQTPSPTLSPIDPFCFFGANTNIMLVVDNGCRGLTDSECIQRYYFLLGLIEAIELSDTGNSVKMGVLTYNKDSEIKLTLEKGTLSKAKGNIAGISCKHGGTVDIEAGLLDAIDELSAVGGGTIIMLSFCQESINDVCSLATTLDDNNIDVISIEDIDGTADNSCITDDSRIHTIDISEASFHDYQEIIADINGANCL